MKVISNPLDLAREAVSEFHACYGESLISGTVYGSAAGGDFDSHSSDINVLLVLDTVSLSAIACSIPIQQRWQKKRVSQPLFMDKKYIAESIDSFPIEFLNMRGCYRVLHGEDVLGPLQIRPEDIRLQLERELKGKLLHLMQEWPRVKDRPQKLSELMQVSLRDFSAAFRALLSFRGQAVPKERKAVFSAVSELCGLNGHPFEKAWDTALSHDKTTMSQAFEAYVDALRYITNMVDHAPVRR